MKELEKKESEVIYGKAGWLTPVPALVGKVDYVSGLGKIDDLLSAKKNLGPISIKTYPKGLVFEFMVGFSYCRFGIDKSDVKEIVIESKEQVYMQKDKSVVGRAVVGGLLLGPIGALVGGMSGLGTKKIQLSDYPDNILTIKYHGEDEKYVVFSVKNKNVKDVYKLFDKEYPGLADFRS